MLKSSRTAPVRYGVSLLTVGLALLVTLQVDLLATRVPFALFFAAVLVSTWYGGRNPGLLAVASSALASYYFIVPPVHSLTLDRDGVLQAVTFLLVALLINWLTAARRRSERLTRESEQRFRLLVEGVKDYAIYTMDTEGRINSWNVGAQRLKGYREEEVLGSHFSRFFPPEQVAQGRPRQLLERAEEEGRCADEGWRVRKDGARFWADAVITALKDEAGGLLGFSKLTRDATEHKRAEEALRESERRYRELVENAKEAIYTHDLAGRFTSLNKAGEEITGYTFGEDLPNIVDLIAPEYRETARRQMSEKVAGGERGAYEIEELEIITEDGRRVALEVSSRLIFKDGAPAGVQGVARDITERRRAETERRLIFEIIQGLITTINLDELLNLIHRSISKILYAENCFVALHDPATDRLSFELWVDKVDPAPPPDPAGKGLTSYVLRTGRPLLLTEEFRRWMSGQGEVEECGRASASWLGVPLRTPSRIIGVLAVQHYDEEGAYTQRDLEFLSSVGDQVALAIERKRAEEALHRSEERYRLLFESNPHPMWVYDLETLRFLTVNEAAVHHYGYAREEFLSMTITDIRPPEDVPALLENVSEVSGALDAAGVWRHRKKGGALIEVEIISHELIFDGRRAELVLATDVTERRRAEEAVREADRRAVIEYERLLERIAALAQALGTAREIKMIFRALRDFALISTRANGLFISLYDPKREERTAAYAWSDGEEVDVSALPPMPMSDSPHSRAVSTGQAVITDDYQSAVAGRPKVDVGDLDQDRLPRSSLAVPMAVMGRVVGGVEVQTLEPAAFGKEHATAMQLAANLAGNAIENVRLLESERAQAEQLRQSQKLESVGQLAGGIAHDFNNLLTVITGYSQLLLGRSGLSEADRMKVEGIGEAAQRAASLTHQLLAFSRKQMLEPKVIDLNDIVSDTDKLLRRLISEDIHLVTIRHPGLWRVKADPGQLTQVIINLAVNARDAMPRGGRLTIETRNVELDDAYARSHSPARPGPYVMLAVSDTGVGMDAETQNHIFEPFFTTKEVGKGTGLGLSMVYGVVKQSGGYVWVYSEPGQGSAFKIYLPRVEAGEGEEQPGAAPPELPRGTETVLLVEDEEMVRGLLRDVLEDGGYTVLEAGNGAEALRICGRHEGALHLVLTDVVMPGMSGRELVERLTEKRRDLKVLYISGYTDGAIVHHGVLDAGMNFLQKPFTLDAVLRKVREVLDARP